jgi:hypothetical protein
MAHNIFSIIRQLLFSDSAKWWEQRYSSGGNSGEGSYGKLAEFKAEVVNEFVKENGVVSVVEFGCGDGNQLQLALYPTYIGLDISKKAVEICEEKFFSDVDKFFFVYNPYHFDVKAKQFKADLALSLDVIYHLVEDDLYITYLKHLFESGMKHVIIYASDKDQSGGFYERQVRHRNFTKDVARLFPNWKLREKIKNKYPIEERSGQTSFSDFFIFEID